MHIENIFLFRWQNVAGVVALCICSIGIFLYPVAIRAKFKGGEILRHYFDVIAGICFGLGTLTASLYCIGSGHILSRTFCASIFIVLAIRCFHAAHKLYRWHNPVTVRRPIEDGERFGI